ncbi:MAG TPA: hypothetical protein VH352_05790 [Pseudonocardiaceae bacterium]|jgi:hypothetical protein|nr:hypothetical protein [Pseudonocardiaceae bacterium]
MILAGIVLAVLAACCYAVAATLQHGAVHTVTAGDRLRLAQLGALARRGRWLAGLLAMGCGAGLHVVSLSVAPLLVVQPIGVLAIGLTALLARPAGRSTLFAVLASTAGVGLFVLLAAPHANATAVPELAAGRVLPVTGLVVVVLVAAAVSARGWARCPLFATAAGVAYGTVSVLARAVAAHVRMSSLPVGPTVLAAAGGLVAIAVGGVCVQQAFAAGRADTVLACETVVDPMIGVLFGVFLFHEARHGSPVLVLGEVAAAALAAAGALVLARRRPVASTTVVPREQDNGPSTSDHHRCGHVPAEHQWCGTVRTPVGVGAGRPGA